MVQIMNDSGHCSRNRAERASLDGKPEYPDATSISTTNHISNIQPMLLELPSATIVTEEEEYEDYRHGARGSTSRPEETNNNLSDTEKDWGLVADPWAATSSFVPPQFDDEDETKVNSDIDLLNIVTAKSEATGHVNTTIFHPHGHPPSGTGGVKYSKSLVSTHRRRKKSKSSASSVSSKRSTKSLQLKRNSSIQTRRRSTQSSCAATSYTSMDIDVASSSVECKPELETKKSACDESEVETESPPTSSIPYCYRCFLKFAKYSHWSRHAIYEHILAKNPYPIVEMNYIDPSSLGIEVTPTKQETEGRYAKIEENSLTDDVLEGDNLETTNALEEAHLGRLRLCIGKEKGAYVVKRKSLGSSENSDDSCPPALDEAPNPYNPLQLHAADSPELNPTPLVMPMLKPCPALISEGQRQLVNPKITLNQPTSANNSTSSSCHVPITIANLEPQYRRMVSIESELETVFNVDMDDFEMALEVATEMSRVDAGTPVTQKPLPGIGSGGVVSSNSASKMISEEVPIVSPAIAVGSENKDLLHGAGDNLLSKLLLHRQEQIGVEVSVAGSKVTVQAAESIPSLVKSNGGDYIASKRSDSNYKSSSKDSENSDEPKLKQVLKGQENADGNGSSNRSANDINTVQTIQVSIEKECEDVEKSEHGSQNLIANEKELSTECKTHENSDSKGASWTKNFPDNQAVDPEADNVDPTPTSPESQHNTDTNIDTPTLAPQIDGDGEADDFECRICHKMFMSDDEVYEHFSRDHFRLAGGLGLLEPESPYPQPQTPQQQRSTIVSGEGGERGPRHNTAVVNSNPSAPQPQQQTQTAPVVVTHPFMDASYSNPNGQVRNVAPVPQPNLMRRPSTDEGGVNHRTAQEELQNIMWRNQLNAVALQGQQRTQGGVPRGFPIMNPLIPGGMRHVGQNLGHVGQRISPPNMTMAGMPYRARSPINQTMSRPPILNYSNSSRPQFGQGGQGTPQQPARLPIQSVLNQAQHRVSPPNYPMSLHHALTNMGGAPHYTQAAISHQRPGSMTQQQQQQQQQLQQQQQQQQQQHQQQNRPPGPMRQMHNTGPSNQYQQQQLNTMRGMATTVRPTGPLVSTIGMNQQMLNQMNVQHQLNNQFQQRLQHHPVHPSMPRLQQIPQQRINATSQQTQEQHHNINPRPGPLSLKRPSQAMGSVEISDVRSSKEPRLENQLQIQRQFRPAELRPLNSSSSSVAAAIGSVGSAGINSVRLGNSITLSVCPTNSTHNSPSTSPLLQDSTSVNKQSSSPSTSGTSSPSGHQVSSVLAVRGVTVTPASPPITSISPVSSPSPSRSPVAPFSSHQQASVIQRGPCSISPENPRDKNFSPPVITTVRGNVHPSNISPVGSHQSHNFAVPRAPPPIQRMQHSPSYVSVTVNSAAERPERPPTVDLTNDDVQAHTNQAHQRISGIIPQHQTQNLNQPTRRFITAQTATFPPSQVPQVRPAGTAGFVNSTCNICKLMFPSIQALESHRLSSHNIQRTNPPPSSTSPSGGPPRPPQVGQPSSVRNPVISRPGPVNPGPNVVHQPVGPTYRPQFAPGSVSILRTHQPPSQIPSESPVRPSMPNSPNNNQAKYLYIPLLDLGRLDATKMRKLEEIGISCVVPLQGNNAMSQMGIPVMNLRGEGVMSQHVPWDSVLPMGPVHQPSVMEQGNNGNRSNSSNNNNPNNNMGGARIF